MFLRKVYCQAITVSLASSFSLRLLSTLSNVGKLRVIGYNHFRLSSRISVEFAQVIIRNFFDRDYHIVSIISFISHLYASGGESRFFSLVYVSDIDRVIIGFDITFENGWIRNLLKSLDWSLVNEGICELAASNSSQEWIYLSQENVQNFYYRYKRGNVTLIINYKRDEDWIGVKVT